MNIRDELFALKDPDYREFTAALNPTVPEASIIGVRLPALRRLVKRIKHSPEAEVFLAGLPHVYFEENLLHGLLIAELRDFDACVLALDLWLPQLNSWALTDSVNPRVLSSDKGKLLSAIDRWLISGDTYAVRFAILSLMRHFLDGDFREDYLLRVARLSHDEYYVKMMQAWYLAEALVKQYDKAVPLLENRVLSPFVHTKTIQKARESFRVPDEVKAYLKSLK